MDKIKVLFVCMGNICRSPTAEGVFRDHIKKNDLFDQFRLDSAGTHNYHEGSRPDKRSQAAALARGVDLSDLRARRVTAQDYIDFDYILAMDEDNHRNLCADSPEEHQGKIKLFMEYAEGIAETEVPDPYYGGRKGFEYVLDLVEAASQGFLQAVLVQHKLKL